ncbi:MAG: glycosyltransferase family 4 protein [Candidatus Omnitrophota bacterium]
MFMNILYLVTTGNIIGGGEISFLNLLENLDRTKFKPYVVAPSEGNFTEKIKNLNIPINIINLKKVKNPLNIYHSIKTIKILIEFVRQNNIHLIHCNYTAGITLLGGISSKFTKIPFFWHVRNIESGGILDLMLGLLASRIIIISKAVRNRFLWLFPKDKIILIYNGVDLDRFNTKIDRMAFRNEIGYRGDNFLIGTVGRFVSWKGYEYFIKSAKIVSQKISNTKFLIVGIDYFNDNKYLNYLRRLTKDLNIEKKVVFLGNREDTPQIMSSLDLFVLPSIGEPFGRVLIEAMACARAIVAFRGGGVAEIVEDGITGFLLTPRDFKGMAEKIEYLLENGVVAETFGKNGRKRAEGLFDIKIHVKKVEDLYSGLIRNGI